MNKIGIIGCRERNDRETEILIYKQLTEIYKNGDQIISGGCRKGGDRIAEKFAAMFGIPILIYYPRLDYHFVENKELGIRRFESKPYSPAGFFERDVFIAKTSDILIATPRFSTRQIYNEERFETFLNYIMDKDVKGGTEHTIRIFLKHKNIYPESYIRASQILSIV